MARFSTSNTQAGSQQNLSASFATIVSLTAAASPQRASIYDVFVGANGAISAATQIIYTWFRQSTVGTGSSATPNPLDGADTAASTVSTVNETVEPTVGAALLTLALNGRKSQRWVARDAKAALVIPAVSLSGIAARAMSPNYTSTVIVNEMFAE